MREADAREQCYAGEHKHQSPKLGVSEGAGVERPGEEPGQRGGPTAVVIEEQRAGRSLDQAFGNQEGIQGRSFECL